MEDPVLRGGAIKVNSDLGSVALPAFNEICLGYYFAFFPLGGEGINAPHYFAELRAPNNSYIGAKMVQTELGKKSSIRVKSGLNSALQVKMGQKGPEID